MAAHPVIIRPIETRDSEGLRAIYNWAVVNTTATMDTELRSRERQQDWLDAHNGLPYPALVAISADTDDLVGYASLSPYIPRAGYRTTAEVSVYVHCDWHGLGIGSALLSSLLVEADRRQFASLLALITSNNEASLRLHRRFGFTDAGTLHSVGRKFDQWLDVVFLERVRVNTEAIP